MKLENKLKIIYNDVFWRCSECNNVYSIDINFCSNDMLDSWIVAGVLKAEDVKELS